MTFEHYLTQQHFSADSLQRYSSRIENYMRTDTQAKSYTYTDILHHLDQYGHSLSNDQKRRHLNTLKRYYDYLIETGQRNDHPCKQLNIKTSSKKTPVFNDLFSSEELASLLHREERYEKIKTKNQVLISLLIYQALTLQEITNLKVQHIDLDKESIYVKGGRVLSSRRLEIHPKQYLLLEQYIHHDRKKLLKGLRTKQKITGQTNIKTDHLLFSFLNLPLTTDAINAFIENLKPRFPDRNLCAKTIRDSVIANLLNEKKLPLEQVQLFAGHRWISSTARYQQAPMDEQKEILNRFYPLG